MRSVNVEEHLSATPSNSFSDEVKLPVSLFVPFQSGLKPPDGLTNVDTPTITGDSVDNLGAFLLGKSVLDPGQHGTERLPRLEDHSEIVPTAYTPDVLTHF